MPDVSFVVAVDKAHVEQLLVVLPVWRKNAQKIFEYPMHVIYDEENVAHEDLAGINGGLFHNPCSLFFHPWSMHGRLASQREKMLTAFACLAPRIVETKWWCKIDTDAFPWRHDPEWLSEKWFWPMVIHDTQPPGPEPVFVAPRWHYSHIRKGGSPMAFDDWADKQPELCKFPRTRIVHAPDAKRVGHKRMCSWISFYRTDWTRWAANLVPDGKLPIPSQDGYHSLLAIRTGAEWRHYPAKKLGWNNYPRFDTLRKAAAAALADGQ